MYPTGTTVAEVHTPCFKFPAVREGISRDWHGTCKGKPYCVSPRPIHRAISEAAPVHRTTGAAARVVVDRAPQPWPAETNLIRCLVERMSGKFDKEALADLRTDAAPAACGTHALVRAEIPACIRLVGHSTTALTADEVLARYKAAVAALSIATSFCDYLQEHANLTDYSIPKSPTQQWMARRYNAATRASGDGRGGRIHTCGSLRLQRQITLFERPSASAGFPVTWLPHRIGARNRPLNAVVSRTWRFRILMYLTSAWIHDIANRCAPDTYEIPCWRQIRPRRNPMTTMTLPNPVSRPPLEDTPRTHHPID